MRLSRGAVQTTNGTHGGSSALLDGAWAAGRLGLPPATRLLLCLALGAASSGLAQAPSLAAGPGPLSGEATQVSGQLGLTGLLERQPLGQTDAAGVMKRLLQHQQVTERVLSASLDIDSVEAVIDYEIEQNKAVSAGLQAKRDRTQNLINVASFVTGGALGVAGTALQFRAGTANLGNSISIAGGATTVALSVVGLRKQAGGRQTLRESPRMLAAFFGRTPEVEDGIASEYPGPVWSYLNSKSSGHPETRREELIARWRSSGYLESGTGGAANSQFALGEVSHQRKLSIDELSARASMLLDIRASVSLMKRDLSEILMSLSQEKIGGDTLAPNTRLD